MRSIYLRNGSKLSVRPIRPDDGERLTEAFARLSPESRYRRFLAIKPNLSEQDARYLVEVDARDHVALLATPAEDPENIVAVARFVRHGDDPGAAEFAISVGDAYQRAGLGSALMERLIEQALERGVSRFTGTILADNEAAHRLVGRLAATTPRWQHLGAVDEVEFALLPDAALVA
jgi:GNAT superfamily N-acetyltransferase